MFEPEHLFQNKLHWKQILRKHFIILLFIIFITLRLHFKIIALIVQILKSRLFGFLI